MAVQATQGWSWVVTGVVEADAVVAGRGKSVGWRQTPGAEVGLLVARKENAGWFPVHDTSWSYV